MGSYEKVVIMCAISINHCKLVSVVAKRTPGISLRKKLLGHGAILWGGDPDDRDISRLKRAPVGGGCLDEYNCWVHHVRMDANADGTS